MAGMIVISNTGDIEMKLCFKGDPDVGGLIAELRNGLIVDPVAVFQKAGEFGLQDVLLLKKSGRLGAEEPSLADKARDHFTDTSHNPLGHGHVTFVSMTDEFASAARKAANPNPRGRKAMH